MSGIVHSGSLVGVRFPAPQNTPQKSNSLSWSTLDFLKWMILSALSCSSQWATNKLNALNAKYEGINVRTTVANIRKAPSTPVDHVTQVVRRQEKINRRLEALENGY